MKFKGDNFIMGLAAVGSFSLLSLGLAWLIKNFNINWAINLVKFGSIIVVILIFVFASNAIGNKIDEGIKIAKKNRARS